MSSADLSRLEVLHVEMGMQCNVRCAMCFQTDFKPSSRLPKSIWNDKLRPAYQAARELVLIGGEPTVLANCGELLQLALREYPHLKLSTATNGIRFQGLWEDAFLQQGACLNFSLNAVTPSLYSRLVRYGDLTAAITNLNRMARRKQELKSSVQLRVSMVIRDDTIDEMPVFVRWAVDHGLDEVMLAVDLVGRVKRTPPAHVRTKIAECYEIGDQNPQLKLLHLAEFDRLFAAGRGLSEVRTWRPPPTSSGPCPIPFHTLHVSYDGVVRPCCVTWYLLGDLSKQSLDEIWDGVPAQRFRRRVNALDFRDCSIGCPYNVHPISAQAASWRQGLWSLRRNPRETGRKVLRRLGFMNPQSNHLT